MSLRAARDGLIDVRVETPCRPFAQVTVLYGPFVITEEASYSGRVDLRLPRLEGVPEAAARLDGTVLFSSLPQGPEPASAYLALMWRGPADLRMGLPDGLAAPEDPLSVGFPVGADARRAEIHLLASENTRPAFVDIEVAPHPCGSALIEASILSSFQDTRLPLSLPAPPCGGEARIVRVPLAVQR